MELLRRALLVGCLLPALWLFRLATLDPLVSIVRVDPAAERKQGPADDSLAVSGPEWELFLRGIDALEQGLGPQNLWRVSEDLPEPGGTTRWVFYRPDEQPIGTLLDRLATRGGAAFISLSRPGGDLRYYRVDRREWTRKEFRPGAGFTGKPVPPSTLLYPFQYVAYACLFVGVALFALIPTPTKAHGGLSPGELASFAAAVLLFAIPLFATGGSVQALTRGLQVTLPCWAFAAVGVHMFAKPGVNAPHPLFRPGADASGFERVPGGHLPTFLRWGIAMLAVAVGPVVALVAVSLTFWNR
jgi:hypothetical protein